MSGGTSPSWDRRRVLAAAGTGLLGGGAGCSRPLGRPSDTAPGTIPGDEPLRVGVLAPTAEQRPRGQSIIDGTRLAAERLENAGGSIELSMADTEANIKVAPDGFEQLVAADADAVVGTTFTGATLECFRPMAEHRVPFLSTGAFGPQPARVVHEQYDEHRYHFRAGPLNTVDIAAMLARSIGRRAGALGWDSAAVVTTKTGPTNAFTTALDDRIQAHLEVTRIEQASVTRDDFGPVYDAIADDGADLALVGLRAGPGRDAAIQWHDQQRPFALVGLNYALQLTGLWEAIDGRCAFGVTATTFTPRSRASDQAAPFVRAYRDRFGRPPEYTGAHAYDAVLALAAAAARAGTGDGDAIVEALEGLELDRSVAFPTLSFRGPDAAHAHDPVWSPDGGTGVPQLAQWQDGELVPFAPPGADGNYQSPPWR